jgi:hypothetical protein
MRVPAVRGVIRRRILVNFRIDPEVMQRQLPAPFRPKLQQGSAIAGICLIRLERIRPRLLPAALGISSENAAHRVAVLWEDDEARTREGVFIPRRDTSSALNLIAGGRLLPGEHHRAAFAVQDADGAIDLRMQAADGQVAVRVRGHPAAALPATSCFGSLAEASAFFEGGALGYSATRDLGRFDGLVLRTERWTVEPLDVDEVYSSYFSDPARFPAGSVAFDCALLMRDINHEWLGTDDLYA